MRWGGRVQHFSRTNPNNVKTVSPNWVGFALSQKRSKIKLSLIPVLERHASEQKRQRAETENTAQLEHSLQIFETSHWRFLPSQEYSSAEVGLIVWLSVVKRPIPAFGLPQTQGHQPEYNLQDESARQQQVEDDGQPSPFSQVFADGGGSHSIGPAHWSWGYYCAWCSKIVSDALW